MDYCVAVQIWVTADTPSEAESKVAQVLNAARKLEQVVSFQLDGPAEDLVDEDPS